MIIVIDGHEYHQTYTPWKTGEHLNSSSSRTRAQDGFVSNEQKNVSTFMEVNNFDSYIIHIYIIYIHIYIYLVYMGVSDNAPMYHLYQFESGK